jgi:hydrogenase maturation protease
MADDLTLAASADGPALPLVIGLGNEHRGDDACGLLVARRLRTELGSVGTVLERSTEGTELLDLWDGRDLVVVVDALSSGSAPGTVRRIEVGAEPLPATLSTTSTHGVSLAQAVALGQALHRLPRRLVIYGIEGSSFAPGSVPSPCVAEAVEGVAREVEAEVRRSHRTRRGIDAGGADA